jgi:hypothetical protein
MHLASVTLSIALLTAYPAVAHASFDDRILQYGCSDTVVVGTVTDNVYGPEGSTGNLLGNGWISASLHVGKVVRGEQLPAILPVSYFARTAMQRNEEVMLVLKQTAGGYEIRAGELMRERPMLASRCS